MKNYQKAEMIAKNLPTGSYAAGCPVNGNYYGGGQYELGSGGTGDHQVACRSCERTA